MVSEALREKSNCVLCRSSKSRFLKKNKTHKISFHRKKHTHTSRKNTQVTRFQKISPDFKE